MGALNIFWVKSKLTRLITFLSYDRMWPCNLFADKSNAWRYFMLPEISEEWSL